MKKGIIIGILIELIFMIPIISLKLKNDKLEKENIRLHQQVIDYKWKKLEKENSRLQQQIIDYKWQLEQIEWIFRTME